jgi:uncharacterized protein YodC (DUF2158 family)
MEDESRQIVSGSGPVVIFFQDMEVFTAGQCCHLKHVLSLTAVARATTQLSKSMDDWVVGGPRMVQSDVSSTGRIKCRNVRKQLVSSAKKLQPFKQQKHKKIDKSGLQSVGM